MNPLLASALIAVVVALSVWFVAVATARRRRIAVGPLPPSLLASVAAVAALAGATGAPPPSVAIVGGVAVAALVDARTGLIFDALNGTLFAAALLLALIEGDPRSALSGATIVGGALGALYAVTAGRGIGLGDVKLAAALGAGLGWHAGIDAVGAAFVIGGLYAATVLWTASACRGATIRFGPFLAAGTWIAAILPAGSLP